MKPEGEQEEEDLWQSWGTTFFVKLPMPEIGGFYRHAADCGEYGHSLPHGETQERASSAEIKLKRVRQFRNVYITLVKFATNLCFSGCGGLSRITDEAAYGLSQ